MQGKPTEGCGDEARSFARLASAMVSWRGSEPTPGVVGVVGMAHLRCLLKSGWSTGEAAAGIPIIIPFSSFSPEN